MDIHRNGSRPSGKSGRLFHRRGAHRSPARDHRARAVVSSLRNDDTVPHHPSFV